MSISAHTVHLHTGCQFRLTLCTYIQDVSFGSHCAPTYRMSVSAHNEHLHTDCQYQLTLCTCIQDVSIGSHCAPTYRMSVSAHTVHLHTGWSVSAHNVHLNTECQYRLTLCTYIQNVSISSHCAPTYKMSVSAHIPSRIASWN